MSIAKKVLIVEDHRPLAKALSLKLKKTGIKSDIAHDGLKALKDMKKDKYDLLVLDLILPKINGFNILKKMKKYHYKMPIIVSTNLSQKEDIQRVKELGVHDYFLKSDTSLFDLVKLIKKYLQKN
jgi:two-component system response regulator VicR